MSKLKISLFFLAGGFTLSFIVGLLSSTGFGILLIRAILFGVLFGAVGYGALWIIEKYIPELFDSGQVNAVDEEQDTTIGKNVNITIDDSAEDAEPNSYQMSGISENTTDNYSSIADNSLDELPNLDGFEASSSDFGLAGDFVEDGTDSLIKNSDMNIEVSNVDTMAKAIQTVLKKDS